jgi:RHH-type transcriptional regulator, proline utilization regulon repressor / proline dehydrogenase / delta 1-pyrroline-5-carboxylate dehydrogenase
VADSTDSTILVLRRCKTATPAEAETGLVNTTAVSNPLSSSVDQRQTLDQQRTDAAVKRAAEWLRAATADNDGRRQRRRLGRAVASQEALSLSVLLADTVMRVPDAKRAGDLFVDATLGRGIPTGLGPIDRVLLAVGANAAKVLPQPVMALVRRRIDYEASSTIGAAEPKPFAKRAAERRQDNFELNINVLGEAILGDEEAQRRYVSVEEMMSRPNVDYVSVKISSLVTQLDPMAFDDSVDRVMKRLTMLYRHAAVTKTFVNLDMEEYRDLDLTIAAFTATLDQPEFLKLPAGIVLQAYLPDSHAALDHLVQWSAQRVASGGCPIKVRLVKGANLAMEQVEAELHGWQAAPYPDKLSVDASYKRLLDSALAAAAGPTTEAIRIGVASHNLFDLAWAATLMAESPNLRNSVEIEMLEGMAPAEARVLVAAGLKVRLYTPVCTAEERVAATAYLVRRLDENGTPGNFLRDAFTMTADSPQFADQERQFREAVAFRREVSTEQRRAPERFGDTGRFVNEPDGDYVLAASRMKMEAALRKYVDNAPMPLMQASLEEVNAAVERASAATAGWALLSTAARAELLNRCAEVMAAGRIDTIALMAVECAKTVSEGDPEVSEAIDFARYYARSAMQLETEATAEGNPRGVVLVVPPWNFPYAITAGGVLAGLAAGNTVIVKPAPEATRTGLHLCEQLWTAGIPRDVLQFIACPDNEVGQRLVTHPLINTVVLTGAYETAAMFASWKPTMHLLAETSGKNALVITAAADVDAAVADLIRSAFGHAGQKCSAASLAIVEASVYDSEAFRRQLRDAVMSLRSGEAWVPTTKVGPVISEPGTSLQRALTTIDPGEEWLVEPRVDAGNSRLWSPGVKLGVQPGSWSHQTEWFGPVLAVMRAPDVTTAIKWANGTSYGLTAGIASLDGDECVQFINAIEAGNVYVNRGTTGAIVQRQPFGGWKRSSVGAGAKAGGPNYLIALQHWEDAPMSSTERREQAAKSYAHWWFEEFGTSSDKAGLVAERNVFRYHPHQHIILRINQHTSSEDLVLARIAAETTGTPLTFSSAETENEQQLAQRLSSSVRIRLLCTATDELRKAAMSAGTVIDESPVAADGRVELTRWVREQAVSITAHRHGSRLGAPVIEL